jgi:catechol 2,3-dioxygenase-like lactoylglutathione lyase family enzyme
MAIERMLAQMTVRDLEPAVAWYTRLFGRGPDSFPMHGLVEWHLADTFGVQVWSEPERAGCSTMVLYDADLDRRVMELNQIGIDHNEIQDAKTARVLSLVDLDGNRIVFVAPLL